MGAGSSAIVCKREGQPPRVKRSNEISRELLPGTSNETAGALPRLFFGLPITSIPCDFLHAWLRPCGIILFDSIYEKENMPLPPATAGRSYSGKFNLRVGEELHEYLAIESAKAGESLNLFCVNALEEKVRQGSKGK